MSTALAELSKTDLLDRFDRMKAIARRANEAKEHIIWKGVGHLAANAGGAAAAISEHVSQKFLNAKYATKVPWLMVLAQDLASLAFEGEAGRAVDAFAHGSEGYLTGNAVKRAIGP